MSGSSLDGLDIVYCHIQQINDKNSNEQYKYEIIKAETFEYEREILEQLKNIGKHSAYEFCVFDRYYGKYIGKQINKFCQKYLQKEQIQKISFVASHGHTIFHTPVQNNTTVQIGHIPSISAECQMTVIGDFRSIDVALNGHGAPLVPIGDQLLFKNYDYCLNFGGINNISFINKNNKRIAFDIGPCNILLNYLAEKLGKNFDENGEIAQKGQINTQLLNQLEKQEFFQMEIPKSLDRNYIEQNFIPILEQSTETIENKLCMDNINEFEQMIIKIKQDLSSLSDDIYKQFRYSLANNDNFLNIHRSLLKLENKFQLKTQQSAQENDLEQYQYEQIYEQNQNEQNDEQYNQNQDYIKYQINQNKHNDYYENQQNQIYQNSNRQQNYYDNYNTFENHYESQPTNNNQFQDDNQYGYIQNKQNNNIDVDEENYFTQHQNLFREYQASIQKIQQQNKLISKLVNSDKKKQILLDQALFNDQNQQNKENQNNINKSSLKHKDSYKNKNQEQHNDIPISLTQKRQTENSEIRKVEKDLEKLYFNNDKKFQPQQDQYKFNQDRIFNTYNYSETNSETSGDDFLSKNQRQNQKQLQKINVYNNCSNIPKIKNSKSLKQIQNQQFFKDSPNQNKQQESKKRISTLHYQQQQKQRQPFNQQSNYKEQLEQNFNKDKNRLQKQQQELQYILKNKQSKKKIAKEIINIDEEISYITNTIKDLVYQKE
ncbi:hypothetical protein PPERSA_07569 [Pseudocohnilembus persalinus]|uniref:Anhydro-N-acetylmuramic acid kinase n=1 Tax=Pseudocohnilembus persalinus TaxID=266149 RepID=A0A0V0R038_PSEPJ|nr:hypothetical protein PPERSA_07569 [Pseudocohnilembus persalinus]|eukprot:KRX07819.1 hypothetical protein PPERSA_07569 [Pseudocohnilembus persalinus]